MRSWLLVSETATECRLRSSDFLGNFLCLLLLFFFSFSLCLCLRSNLCKVAAFDEYSSKLVLSDRGTVDTDSLSLSLSWGLYRLASSWTQWGHVIFRVTLTCHQFVRTINPSIVSTRSFNTAPGFFPPRTVTWILFFVGNISSKNSVSSAEATSPLRQYLWILFA